LPTGKRPPAGSAARSRPLHDPATGLPNRVLFEDRVTQGISLAERHGWSLTVMFLDLDRFKSINDDHGHAAGDLVLREVASRLSQHARDEDTVCRSGGDEFLYLLVNPKSKADVERKAIAVLGDIAQAIEVGGVASSSARASGLPCIRVTARRSTSSYGTPTRRCTAPRTAHVAMSCSAPCRQRLAPDAGADRPGYSEVLPSKCSSSASASARVWCTTRSR
jgi:diguanylate cyclase (GGDEF)-like protein